MVAIEESSLVFDFPDGSLWQPELTVRRLKLSNVKACDFVYVDRSRRKLFLIEVKSSAPKDLREYVDEITQKFGQTLLLALALHHERYLHDGSPAFLLAHPSVFGREYALCPLLIIRRTRRDWLFPLQEALQRSFRQVARAFRLEPPLTLDVPTARRKIHRSIHPLL